MAAQQVTLVDSKGKAIGYSNPLQSVAYPDPTQPYYVQNFQGQPIGIVVTQPAPVNILGISPGAQVAVTQATVPWIVSTNSGATPGAATFVQTIQTDPQTGYTVAETLGLILTELRALRALLSDNQPGVGDYVNELEPA